MASKFFSAPNLLTLSRIPLGAIVWLRPLDPVFVLIVMAIAGTTDVLDGWLERRRRARLGEPAAPTVGVWLDPLCDKLFILSVLAAIAFNRRTLGLLPMIATREILQTLIAIAWRLVPAVRRRLKFQFGAAYLGKAATVAQFLAVRALLIDHPAQMPLAILTSILGFTAAMLYLVRAVRAGAAH